MKAFLMNNLHWFFLGFYILADLAVDYVFFIRGTFIAQLITLLPCFISIRLALDYYTKRDRAKGKKKLSWRSSVKGMGLVVLIFFVIIVFRMLRQFGMR
jgi:cadmium resistance protein CadD (predicted permease)